MVTMWRAADSLMWSTMAATVVVLPDPVGPVMRIRPRGSSARRRIAAGRPRVSKPGMLAGTSRRTRPSVLWWRKTFTRNRLPSPAVRAKSTSPARASWSDRSGGRIEVTIRSMSAACTTSKVVLATSPSSRSQGREPALTCTSEARRSAAWRSSSFRSTTTSSPHPLRVPGVLPLPSAEPKTRLTTGGTNLSGPRSMGVSRAFPAAGSRLSPPLLPARRWWPVPAGMPLPAPRPGWRRPRP